MEVSGHVAAFYLVLPAAGSEKIKSECSPTSSTVPWGQTQPDRGSLQLDCATLDPCCWPGGSRLEQVRRQERGE